MQTPEVRLVPARPEHLDDWIAIRAGATSRRLVSMEEDSREALLKRLAGLLRPEWEAGTGADTVKVQ